MLKYHLDKLNNYADNIIYYDDIPSSNEEIIKRIDDADCILLSYTTILSKDILIKCHNLK